MRFRIFFQKHVDDHVEDELVPLPPVEIILRAGAIGFPYK